MQRNIITTLGTLRIGDRFCFTGKADVWQVVNFIGRAKVAINQFDPNTKKRLHVFDIFKSSSVQVKFLRHTVFEFGDDCFIENLEPGNVFTLGTNIVIEYELIEKIDNKFFAKQIDTQHPVWFPFGTEVSFIRKAKEKEK